MRFVALLLVPIGMAASQEPVPTDPAHLPRYDLTVDVTLGSAPALAGTARIALPPVSVRRDSVAFALSELFDVRDARLHVSGRAPETMRLRKRLRPNQRAYWGSNTWSATPDVPIPAGTPVTLEVTFATNRRPIKGDVFSVGQETAFASAQNTAWYPTIEEAEPHPLGRLRGLRATGQIAFVFDTGVKMHFPAPQTSRSVDGARQRLRYDVTAPTFFGFAMGGFTVVGGTYYLKPRAAARLNDSLAQRVFRVLEHEFGPRPFSRFAVVEVPTADADSAGFAGASLDGFILATSDFLDRPFNTAYYGHEIGHQWWGVTIRATGSGGGWLLSEAMSQYGSLRAVEQMDPPGLAERFRRDEYPGYLGHGARLYFDAVSKGQDTPLLTLSFDSPWSRPLADSKGFMAWNALSDLMGRDVFRRALASITSKYSTSRLTWDIFVRELEAHTSADVKRFVADWFTRSGIPEWEVRLRSSTAELVQIGEPYLVSVRVDVRTPSCQVETHRLLLSGRSMRLPSTAGSCGPPSYVVDPEYQVIHWTPELRKRYGVPR